MFHIGLQVKNCGGDQCDAKDIAGPNLVRAAHYGARDLGVDVTIGQHDESRAQRRNNLILQAIGEIGGVDQRVGDQVQGVALLGALQSFAGQGRARQAGVQHGVTTLLQPEAQFVHLRGTAHAVGALQDDQLALQVLQSNTGDTASVESKLSHG